MPEQQPRPFIDPATLPPNRRQYAVFADRPASDQHAFIDATVPYMGALTQPWVDRYKAGAGPYIGAFAYCMLRDRSNPQGCGFQFETAVPEAAQAFADEVGVLWGKLGVATTHHLVEFEPPAARRAAAPHQSPHMGLS
jgi:hypothetical protein